MVNNEYLNDSNLCEDCHIDEDMKNNLDALKQILNDPNLDFEKSYYCNLQEESLTCLMYYSKNDPPAVIHYKPDNNTILVYIIRFEECENPLDALEVYHFTHIFEFHLFSDDEIQHFIKTLKLLIFDEICSLLNSDFQYIVYK